MKKLLAAVALSAFMAGPALADGVVTLTDAQIDKVTAGLNNVNYNGNNTASGGVADGNGTANVNTNNNRQRGNQNGNVNGGVHQNH